MPSGAGQSDDPFASDAHVPAVFSRPEIPAALLAALTPNQQRAVRHLGGPALVLAGPGSGKTRVITRRIAALLAQGVRPYNVLAVTFTNKAAAEMRERVAHVLGESNFRGLTVSTFHSLCVRLLRRYAVISGLVEQGWLKADFTIVDSDDQSRMIKEAVKGAQLSTENFPPRTVLAAISGSKNQLIDEHTFAARATDFHGRQIAKAYKNYQYLLRKSGALDFDDLLSLAVRMLATSDKVRADVQDHYRYLLVDEYQDTNAAQFLIAALIAGNHVLPDIARFAGGLSGVKPQPVDSALLRTPNIMVVGDPDQSIYGWRGADINNILDFEKLFPRVQIIPLGENFRSRDTIVAVADRLIKVNTQRKHKALIPTRKGGLPVEIVACRDEHHEARLVVDWAQRLKADGIGSAPFKRTVEWKDIAVFYRTNALSRVIEDAFRRAGVPYHLVRGTAFFQREEVRNAVAYLRIVSNPSDAVSLDRVINTPTRGISDNTIELVQSAALHDDLTVIEVLREVAASTRVLPGLTSRAINSIGKFLIMLDGWRAMFTTNMQTGERATLRDLVEAVVTQSGLKDHYKKDPEDEERLANIYELINAASEFEQQLLDAQNGDPDTAFDEATRAAAGASLVSPTSRPASADPVIAPVSAVLSGPAVPPVPVVPLVPAIPPVPAVPSAHAGPRLDLFGEPLDEDDTDFAPMRPVTPANSPAEVPDFLAMPDEGSIESSNESSSESTGKNSSDLSSESDAAITPSLLSVLQKYLEQIALTADSDGIDTEAGAVQLMTLHAAKGLEYPAVTMIGLEHGVLPHFRATQSIGEQATKDMEEERRLCFVGITRAMDQLMLTTSKFRSARGFSERTIPSHFLDELRGPGVVFSDQSDPFGGAQDDTEMHDFLGDADSGYASRVDRPPAAGSVPAPVSGRSFVPNAGGSPGTGKSAVRGHAASTGGFSAGDAVKHPQFGDGKVLAIYPGVSPRITVQFKAAGIKTLVLEYARISRVR